MIHSRYVPSVELNWVKVETLKHTSQLENLQKIRWYQSHDPTISLSCKFQRNDNKAQNKYLYTYIQSNTIPNSPRVETIQIYINRWMDKQRMIHPHNGILFSPEKIRKFWSIQCGWTLKTLYTVKKARHERSHIVWYVWNIWNMYSIETGRKPELSGDWEEVGMRINCLRHMGFPFGVMIMFWNLIEVMLVQLWLYQMMPSCTL